MREQSGDVRGSSLARTLRLVLQVRDAGDVTRCEQLTFAFARDAGLRGESVCYAAACAARLAEHLVARGTGELELRVVDWPRAALEMTATDDGPALDGLTAELLAARRSASEMRIAWHATHGAIVTARCWLGAA
jgi:hypothetical protein